VGVFRGPSEAVVGLLGDLATGSLPASANTRDSAVRSGAKRPGVHPPAHWQTSCQWHTSHPIHS
jgi:hypothetical protein